MLREFRKFMLRGNVLDLAVAVIIGAAFGAVIASLVADVITPVIAAIFGQPDFSDLTIEVGNAAISYGRFLNAVFAFLVIAFVLFLVIRSFERVQELRRTGPTPEAEAPVPSDEALILGEIRDLLRSQRA